MKQAEEFEYWGSTVHSSSTGDGGSKGEVEKRIQAGLGGGK